MVKKLKKIIKGKRESQKYNDKKKFMKKVFKKTLHPKIEYLINLIKKYKNPNEYTRQDQDQKLLKYMKLNHST